MTENQFWIRIRRKTSQKSNAIAKKTEPLNKKPRNVKKKEETRVVIRRKKTRFVAEEVGEKTAAAKKSDRIPVVIEMQKL